MPLAAGRWLFPPVVVGSDVFKNKFVGFTRRSKRLRFDGGDCSPGHDDLFTMNRRWINPGLTTRCYQPAHGL